MNDSLTPFKAHWLVRGGVAQTILGSQFPGETYLPPRKIHKIEVGSRSQIIALELENKNTRSPIILLAHGMGGCSESGYIRRIASRIWKRDFGVFMMNQRGSGVGLGLSETLWNGGSSEDMEQMVRYIVKLYPKRALLIVGFSLSGNVLLKYLGEGRKTPRNIHGAFAVNPTIDLRTASQLLCNGKGSRIFNPYFMKLLRRQCQALGECFPEAVQPQGKFKNIWDFDVVYTAPAAGFQDVEEYYRKSSARQFIESIEVPTQILCAKNDPFIPLSVFDGIRENGYVNYLFPDRGGHMGYLASKTTPLGDRRWMDYAILDWVLRGPGPRI
jgi:predicted alpha/beta-fold hydrolase